MTIVALKLEDVIVKVFKRTIPLLCEQRRKAVMCEQYDYRGEE